MCKRVHTWMQDVDDDPFIAAVRQTIINCIRRAKCVIVALMSCSMFIEWSYVRGGGVRTE